MSTLQDALDSYIVRPETTAAMAIATDGIKTESKVAMIALYPLDDEPVSLFIRGADIAATRQYHGIPDEVYDSLAVDPEEVRDTLQMLMDQKGIHNIVAHQAFRFVRDRLIEQKLIYNKVSFLDTVLMDKAVMYWTRRLLEADTLGEFQAKIANMRGGNRSKIEPLLEKYGIKPIPENELSPYVPENKARMAKELFQAMLKTELAF